MGRIERAILVDDEQFEHLAFHRLLGRLPNIGEIHSFLYADEAIAFLKATCPRPYDVVFLDINMPRMNGFEFLDAAEAVFGETLRQAVIVMLTTSLDPSDRARADSYVAVKAFVNKPLDERLIEDARALLVAAPHGKGSLDRSVE